MAETLIVTAKPPRMDAMLAGGVFLLGAGAGANLWVGLSRPEALVSFWSVLLWLPFALGGAMLWVGLTGDKMRRPLATLTREGAQVGTQLTLAWGDVARIERRGSGTRDTLILHSDKPRETRRVIPVGRAEGDPDALVSQIMALARQGGYALRDGRADGANKDDPLPA